MDAVYFIEGNNVIAGVRSSIVPPPSGIVTIQAKEYIVISTTYSVTQDPTLDSRRGSMIANVYVRRL